MALGATSQTAPQSHPPPASFPHSLPPSVLRLLSLSSPLVNAIHSFIHLATWTAPHGGGVKSCILLLAWTLLCLFAYPVLRYAPQTLVLALVIGSAIPNIILPHNVGNKGGSSRLTAGGPLPSLAPQTLTQSQTDLLLQKLSDILDVCSTVHAQLVLPVWQALTWQHPAGPSVTTGAAIMATTLGVLWTLCFADWPVFLNKLTAVVPLDLVWSTSARAASSTGHLIKTHVYDVYLRAHGERLVQQVPVVVQLHAYLAAAYAWLLARLPTSLSYTYLPPFPLFSLSLSDALLVIGLIGLSWCSTYATLVRHAMWKSASVRRLLRSLLRLFSLGYIGGDAPVGYFVGDTTEQASRVVSVGKASEKDSNAAAAASGSQKTADSSSPTRVNTVAYRFELYENQRWWMGLDWTAALLPQERPSWTDSSLSPVSPPSSFTLPAESVQWRPKPTKEKADAWEKRIIRWKWVEEEWRVVVNVGGGLGTGAGEKKGSSGRRQSSTSASGGPSSPRRGSGAGDGIGSEGSTLFSSFTSRNGTVEEEGDEDTSALSSVDSPGPRAGGAGEEEFADDFSQETDASGWRYGDNAWEKMTSKSGMGKYTRRRKWVRRARMEEIVIQGIERPAAASASSSSAADSNAHAEHKQQSSGDAALSTPEEKAHASDSTAAPSVKDSLQGQAKGTIEVSSGQTVDPTSSPRPDRGDLKSRLTNATSR